MGVMFLFFERLVVGSLGTNCYIIGCPDTMIGAVVDPGEDSDNILKKLNSLQLQCKYIILTHGHIDHIGALAQVHAATGAEVLIHKDDAPRLLNPNKYSYFLTVGAEMPQADRLLEDGDKIQIGNITWEVIHTPGHSPGGICLKHDNLLITGDTLFQLSVGRSDLPGGSHEVMINSIKTRLLGFPDDTRVFPGHGPFSTIGTEKRFNPFL